MRMALATIAASAVLAVIPTAAAAPASDGQGYVNSTARCSSPDSVAVFGSTDASRVAVCKTAGGHYEYRGVRLSDGARLIVAADATDDGAFVAHNGKISYLVTAKSLVVSDGKTVIREEPIVDFHGPQDRHRHRRSRPRKSRRHRRSRRRRCRRRYPPSGVAARADPRRSPVGIAAISEQPATLGIVVRSSGSGATL